MIAIREDIMMGGGVIYLDMLGLVKLKIIRHFLSPCNCHNIFPHYDWMLKFSMTHQENGWACLSVDWLWVIDTFQTEEANRAILCNVAMQEAVALSKLKKLIMFYQVSFYNFDASCFTTNVSTEIGLMCEWCYLTIYGTVFRRVSI